MSNEKQPADEHKFGRFVHGFERGIVVALVIMIMLIVLAATIELAWLMVREFVTPPILEIGPESLLELFGFILLVLIGLELVETIKSYLKDNVIRVEVVLELALIAIARKVIVLDIAKYDGVQLLAIAALIVATSAAFFLERRARRRGSGVVPGP